MADLSDDFDFSITLEKGGWMTFMWFRGNGFYEDGVSDAVGAPLHDLMQLLLALLNNEQEYTIRFFLGQGWTDLTVTRNMAQRNLIKIEVVTDGDQFLRKKIIDTEITQYRFIIIAYQQLKKIKLLLKERHYAKSRIDSFPFDTFQQLSDKLAASLPEVC
ncbi:hypothetical protein [Chitinophaga sp. Cy-1792]|uniref:hypothetical protein n=1 Tax=Chitinophaga sp. Cy-1792 TaxID=2608339 RepID=UPI00141EFC55|nr:hypothetical protein [Chitinophaga sp. Cy-1792]NIG55449.1 hypothetical protein [Chitinophaga sp. Cy-1792]